MKGEDYDPDSLFRAGHRPARFRLCHRSAPPRAVLPCRAPTPSRHHETPPHGLASPLHCRAAAAVKAGHASDKWRATTISDWIVPGQPGLAVSRRWPELRRAALTFAFYRQGLRQVIAVARGSSPLGRVSLTVDLALASLEPLRPRAASAHYSNSSATAAVQPVFSEPTMVSPRLYSKAATGISPPSPRPQTAAFVCELPSPELPAAVSPRRLRPAFEKPAPFGSATSRATDA